MKLKDIKAQPINLLSGNRITTFDKKNNQVIVYRMTERLSIFDFINKTYKITKPIRLIELFAGIGSQAQALKNIGANFEHYKWKFLRSCYDGRSKTKENKS